MSTHFEFINFSRMSEDPRLEFDLGSESEFNQILYSVSANGIFRL